MAKKHVYSILIDGDISGLEASMKSAVKTVADGYDKMAKAADKVKHLKDVVGYISQVDNALDVLYHKNPDAFLKAFDGLDEGLKGIMQNLFNIEEKGLNTLGDLGAKINSIDGTEGVKAMRKMAEDINSLYEAIGQAPPINMADGLFEGKGGQKVIEKRIETLKNAYSEFALVWNGINDKIGKGLNFGAAGGVAKSGAKTIVDELKAVKQMVKDVNDFKPIELGFDATVEEADRLMKKFDELNQKRNAFIANGDMESEDYAATYAELVKTAAKLIEVREQLSKQNIAPVQMKTINDFIDSDDIGIEDLLEEYLQDVDGLVANVTSKLQEAMNSIGSAVDGGAIENAVRKTTEKTVDAIEYGKQKIVEAWKEYYHAVQDAKADGYNVEDGDVSLKMMKSYDAVIKTLEKFGAVAKTSKWGVEKDLDLSDYIIDGDIGLDDIEDEINNIFKDSGISFTASLEEMMPKDVIQTQVEETVSVIDQAKKILTKALQDYYNAVEAAHKSGIDTSFDESVSMSNIKDSILNTLDVFGANSKHKTQFMHAIDSINNDELDFDDIEGKVSYLFKLFAQAGQPLVISLESVLSMVDKSTDSVDNLGSATQENSQNMVSDLAQVENKTVDIIDAFRDLISYVSDYVSMTGDKPAVFFDSLESGAKDIDGELESILQKLNLIDAAGNIKFDSITSGYTNKGGFVSDKYTMIARPEHYLPKIQSLQSMLQQAAQDGAQIGRIVDIIRDEKNNLIYEVQNTVSGEAAFSHHKGDINQSVLNASEEQLKSFIQTIKALSDNGLFIDWGGDNVLYDPEKGFSVIDLGTKGGKSHTVSLANTVEENVNRFISEMMKFAPSGLKDQIQNVFADKVQKMMNEVLSPSATSTQSTKASTDAVSGLSKEAAAHKANADAIEEENKALQEKISLQQQAQETLKSKAQTMTFKDFIMDESLFGLMNTAGLHSLAGMEHFWKQSNYAKQIDYHELTQEDKNNILKSLGVYTGKDGSLSDIIEAKGLGKLSADWYGFEADFSAKTIMENMALADDELRNVAMNRLWEIYKSYVDATISFTDFLNTPFEVWIGDKTHKNQGPAIFNEDQLLSYSFKKGISNNFAGGSDGTLLSTMITPKETIGSFNVGHNQSEAELFVPTYAYPAHPLYKNDKYKTFQDYYDDQLGTTTSSNTSLQAEIDAFLIQLEKQRVENILGKDLSKLIKEASSNSSIFKTGALNEFEQGIIPDTIVSDWDYDNDELAKKYNQFSETQKRLVAYYAHLNQLASSTMSNINPKEIGMSGIVGAVLNDPIGLKSHIANLTGEAKYNIFGHGITDFISELYKQNTGPSQTSNRMTEEKKKQAKYQEVVYKLSKVKSDMLWDDGYDEVIELYDFIKGIEQTSQEDLDDGMIFNQDTGEIKSVSEIIAMIDSIEQQYGKNLQFVKDYLQQTYRDAIQTSGNTQLSYNQVSYQLAQAAGKYGGSRQGFDMQSLWYDLKGVSNATSGLIEDGYYTSELTGEVLEVKDLYKTVQDIEQKYSENLSYVRDYLKQVYSDIDFDNLPTNDSSTDSNQVIDKLFDLKNKDPNLPFSHWSDLDDIQSFVYGAQHASRDDIGRGLVKNIFDPDKAVTVSELLSMIQDVENQYGDNLQFVKDYIQQVYKNALQDAEPDYSYIEDAKAEYDNVDSKLNKQYFNAIYGSAEEAAIKRLMSTLGEIKQTDNNVLSQGKYGTYFEDASSLFNQVLEIESQYGTELDYVKEWLQKIFKDKISGLDNLDIDDDWLDIEELDLDYESKQDTGVSNAEQELAIERQITEEKKEQLALDNAVDTSIQSTALAEEAAVVSNTVQQESTDLIALAEQVAAVEAAIKAKTAAFEAEGTTVSSVVQQEIAELTKLLEILQQITGQVNIATAGLTKMSTEAPVVDETPVADDAKEKSKDKAYYTEVFAKYRADIEKSGYATTELKDKISYLDNEFQNVSTPEGLKQWIDSFNELKSAAEKAKKDYVKIEESKIAQMRGEVNSKTLFKGLDFDITTSNLTAEQKEIIALREKLLSQLSEYEAKVKAGEKAELSSVNATRQALFEKLKLYKEQHDYVNASGKSGNKYTAKSFKSITGKVNSLTEIANSDEFANSPLIMAQLQNMTDAYNNLANARRRFANIDALTSEQEAEYDSLASKANEAVAALKKLITESQKLKSQKANTEDFILDDDFVDTDMGRKAALEEFVKVIYPASAGITQFKNNYTEAMFAINNGDGTITNMTAKFDKARTEIVALANSTQKVIGPFEAFTSGVWDKLKTLSTYFTASEILQRTWQEFKEGIQSIRDIDAALTELKKVTDETDATYSAFLQDMSKTASVVGSTVKDLVSSSADWGRLGYNLKDAGELAATTAKLLNVSEFTSVEDATSALVSTLQAFTTDGQDVGQRAEEIVDILNNIGKYIACR